MNQIPGLMHAALRGALPWLGVLAISASVAYAMTVAVVGGAAAGDPPAAIAVAETPADALLSGVPGSPLATPPAIDPIFRHVESGRRGSRMLYVGLNSWIPVEPMIEPCAT